MVTKATATPQEKAVVSAKGSSVPDYIPGMDWSEFAANADSMAGHDLAKDDLLDALVGIPFGITRLTFRKGIKRQNGVQAAYVSAECVIADAETLKRRRTDFSKLAFEPGSQVVFNDGSTGIYRQLVAYLAFKGMITLPEELPEEGNYGESRYDLPPTAWSEFHDGEVTTEDDGWIDYSVNVRLACPRGIRLSEYASDYGDSKTRYIA